MTIETQLEAIKRINGGIIKEPAFTPGEKMKFRVSATKIGFFNFAKDNSDCSLPLGNILSFFQCPSDLLKF